MAGWNLADVFEIVAQEIPDSTVLIQGARRLTWAQLDRRAGAIAAYLASRGLKHQANVTQYLHNAPEYIESLLGCVKGAFVPFNTNYRYGAEELVDLWNGADAAAVVFHGCFAATIERIRHRVAGVQAWLWVDDGSGACPAWAVSYESIADAFEVAGAPHPGPRSGDDLILVYTGGTTGMPKGVMWRQDDLFVRLNTERGDPFPDTPDPATIRASVSRKGRPHLTAVPLMHGAGLLTCFLVLARGGAISHLTRRSFDPVDLLDTIERDRAASVMWVGDAFARPTLAALQAAPGRWDLSCLKTIMSSGMIFSADVKQALLEHLPDVTITDIFGSSESMSLGRSVATRGAALDRTGSFRAKPDTRVIDENGRDVAPGTGERGLLAIGGRQPLGYYKDAGKTAQAFRVFDGRRYAVPGDWATLEADGTVRLLGRGSECINTGGEKVFPDEVEAVLRRFPGIGDAVVIGLPDERFGQMVAAVVEPEGGARLDPAAIIAFVKSNLAGFKAPRRIITVASIGRGPHGKADLKRIREMALSMPA